MIQFKQIKQLPQLGTMRSIFEKLKRDRSFLFFRFCGFVLYSSPLGWWHRRTFAPSKLKRVLINMARPGMGMGDQVQVTSLVTALHNVSPEVQIFILISGARCPDIVSLFPVNVEIIQMPTYFYFYGHRKWLFYVWKHLRPKRFDLVINQYMECWLSVFYVSIFSRSRWVISYASHLGRKEILPNNIGTMILRERPQDEFPFLYNKELAKYLQYHGMWRTSLKIDRNTLKDAEKTLTKLGINSNDLILGIHPGCTSSHLFRRWPVDNFIATAKRFVSEYKGKVLVFGGPDEELEVFNIQRQISDVQVGAITGHIKEVTALINRCDIFLSNDSGFMHISQAVKVPTVAIYGPTNPEKFDTLYTYNYFIRLRGDVSCKPCLGTTRVKECGNNTPICITAVSSEQAYNALKKLLIESTFGRRENVCYSV